MEIMSKLFYVLLFIDIISFPLIFLSTILFHLYTSTLIQHVYGLPREHVPLSIRIHDLVVFFNSPYFYVIYLWLASIVVRVVFLIWSGNRYAKNFDIDRSLLPIAQFFVAMIFALFMLYSLGAIDTQTYTVFDSPLFPSHIPVLQGYHVDPYNTFNATPVSVYSNYIEMAVNFMNSIKYTGANATVFRGPKWLYYSDLQYLGGKNLTNVKWMFVETMKNNNSTAYLFVIDFPQLPNYLNWVKSVGINPDRSAEVERAFISSVPGNWTNVNGVYYTVYDNSTFAVTTSGSTVVALVVYNNTLPLTTVAQFVSVVASSLLGH